MLITGNTFRNIYTQTGDFFFEMDMALSNTTGECAFGFSGSSGVFEFTFRDGKIIYPNKQIVSYYNSGEKVGISGFVHTGSGLISVRGKAFNLTKPAHHYDYFYINPTGCTVDANVIIDGQIPDWSLDSSGCFKSGEAINFQIRKDSAFPYFRIFSGSAIFPSGFTLETINPADHITSGYNFRVLTSGLIYQGTGDNAVYPLVILFNTNYGDITKDYTVFKYNDIETRFDVFPPTSPVTLEKNSQISLNIKALYVSPSGFVPVPVSIGFQHISGSGDRVFEFDSVVTITGGVFISGFVFGSGFITGLYTGSVPGTGCVTGNVNVSGIMSIAAFGGSGTFTVTGFGIGTGIAWGGRESKYQIFQTGYYRQNFTGTYDNFGRFTTGVSGVLFTGVSYDLFSSLGAIVPHDTQNCFNTPWLLPTPTLQHRYFSTVPTGLNLNSFGQFSRFKSGVNTPGFYILINGGDGPDWIFEDHPSGVVAGHSGFFVPTGVVTATVSYTGSQFNTASVSPFGGTGYLMNTVFQPGFLFTGNFSGYNQVTLQTGAFSLSPNTAQFTSGSGFSGQYYTTDLHYTLGSFLRPLTLSGYRGTGFITASSQSGLSGRAIDVNQNVWATSGANTGWIQFNVGSGFDQSGAVTDLTNPIIGCTDYQLLGYTVISSGAFTGNLVTIFYTGATPKTWDVSGSNDGGVTWDLVDSRTGVPYDHVAFANGPQADTQRGQQWFCSNQTGYYKLFRFNFYETFDAASTQLAINRIGCLGRARILADTSSGLSASKGYICSGIGKQTDGTTVSGTGSIVGSGLTFSSRQFTFTGSGFGTGHVPVESIADPFGSNGVERWPGVPASGLISGSQDITVSGGRIFGANILTGQQTFYSRVWRTPIDITAKYRNFEKVFYSGGHIIGTTINNNFGQFNFGFITGFTSGVPSNLIRTGISVYALVTGILGTGRTQGAFYAKDMNGFNVDTVFFIQSGNIIPTGGTQAITYSLSGATMNYVLPFTGDSVIDLFAMSFPTGATGITFDYFSLDFSGLIIDPSGTSLPAYTGTDTLTPIKVFVSGYDSPFTGYGPNAASFGQFRHSVLITGGAISGLGLNQPNFDNVPIASGMFGYYAFIPTGTQTGISFKSLYVIDSGRVFYTETLDRPYYVGKITGYSVNPSPLYKARNFVSGNYGYYESGFLYNDNNNLETRPFTGAWNYYPTGLHNADYSSTYNYPYSVSGSQISIRVPLFGIPVLASGISGETLTGRYTGLNHFNAGLVGFPNYNSKLSQVNKLTGTLGVAPFSGYTTGLQYDQNMVSNFVGMSINTVLIQASGFVVAEFSGDISVTGFGHVPNSFPNNWKLYTGKLQTIFDEATFIPNATSFNDNGWFTPSSIFNQSTGNNISGDYTNGATLLIRYTGSCATGYLAKLTISGLNINSGFVIDFSGKNI